MLSNEYISNNNNKLTIKTVQIAPFRILMAALKDILLETNIVFTKQGIKIINMDKTHTILVHLFLKAENFEFFECKEEKIIVGVNILHLFKLITTIDNDDTLTIYIENDDYNEGIVTELGLKFENGTIKQSKIQKLKLIEPEQDELEIPDVKFSSVINMPSNDFQKIIRDLANISEKIEIKSVEDELIFKCSGQFAKAEIRRSENNANMQILNKQHNKIIQGEYSLKNLLYFIKCTNLCNQIEIYLENNRPLIVKYNVASLGEIKMCLSSLPSSNN
jgi:proliferating cell nuclear antigen|uniref:Proliferating cell nuclear antigen PCNA N-terminal domain-containing protein n=1 Tax=viral metagenome TaxID=1070528 RepID=A0A6C0KR04_9ZZZZ